jgi:hypothetical protein
MQSQTYFRKLDDQEKNSRLWQLSQAKVPVIVWLKGQKEKYNFDVLEYDKELFQVTTTTTSSPISSPSKVLVSFEYKGMNFFSEATQKTAIGGKIVFIFDGILYKSERRSSFRLMTYPIYEVYGIFPLDQSYQGGNIVQIKSGQSQTGLFKNFLKLVEPDTKQESEEDGSILKIRIQDFSTTGLSIHVGEIEKKYFPKDMLFKNMQLSFTDDVIVIPEAKVVYIVDFIGDKGLKKIKVGIHFENLTTQVDEALGKKINKLLRDVDSNKDFENFLK